jgi:hypothetical protein
MQSNKALKHNKIDVFILNKVYYSWLQQKSLLLDVSRKNQVAPKDIILITENLYFVSEGPNGKIPKLVQYTPTNLKDLYNLAFVDENEENGEIDGLAVSNNEDSEQVLATVVTTNYALRTKIL